MIFNHLSCKTPENSHPAAHRQGLTELWALGRNFVTDAWVGTQSPKPGQDIPTWHSPGDGHKIGARLCNRYGQAML
jgi:hypothetical protein